MSYPTLDPKPLTQETRKLIENISDEVPKFDKVHFGFNGATSWPDYGIEYGGGYMGRVYTLLGYQEEVPPPAAACRRRVMLPPNKQTNDQNVKVEMKDFANGHKTSKLWTIVLKYSIEHWNNLMTWTRSKEVTFDAMLYASRGGHFIHRSFFHCFMTRDESCEYQLTQDNFTGIAKIYFKKGGIKIVKKEDKVVVVVKLLEAGFYQRYNYVVVEPKNPQTGDK